MTTTVFKAKDNPEQIAWMAGLYEGEGTLGAYKVKRGGYFAMCIKMCDEDIVRRFHDLAGTGTVTLRKAESERHRPQFVWRTYNEDDIKELVDAFWPWLGERRREQATLALAKLREVKPLKWWEEAMTYLQG